MIRNIITLTSNDLAIALKNKTLYLILFIPLFVFFTLQLVDQTDAGFQKIKIGLIEKDPIPPPSSKVSNPLIRHSRSSGLPMKREGKRGSKKKKGTAF